MKNSTLYEWLFTPFKFIAGNKALIIGIVVLVLLSILGYLGNVHFTGVIGFSIADINYSSPYLVHAVYQISAWLSMVVVFYITARIVSKSAVRLVDIAGTMAISQAPFLLIALFGLIPAVHLSIGNPEAVNLPEIIQILKDNIVMISIISIISILVMVWSIILKYNAYSVSANIKGISGGISFTIAIIFSEILSRLINYVILPLII